MNPSNAAPSRLRRSLQRLITPAALDFWSTRFSRLWTWQQPVARVVAREAASADAVTLTLRANRHWRGLRAGQHLNVSVEIDGRQITRSYSPSPVPGRPRRFRITVKRYADGQVSRRLCDGVRRGDVLRISQAFGAMNLGEAFAPRLFLAAGSGITPLIAMIREWAAQPSPAPLALAYWARRRDELCFVDELRALARGNDAFKLRFLLTGEAAAAADEAEGRIDASQIAALGLPLEQTEVSACGPDAFVAAARGLLEGRVAAFHSESFTPPAVEEATGGLARITLALRGQTIEVARGTPLLGALEALGVDVTAGCRRGICHTCSCAKRQGASRDLRDGSVSNEPASALQLCVSAALGDLVLEL
ncbi:ferredoxin reductase [Pseudomarimonas salicorniae]|uniref:Ferredoxin reductase n=1 Tax=Pseudomarimonas salicorniae TaxID=2933270 RepID=A0ABT0GME6_9GAMM|nr:ferredoxin reductase [Lysobacter sp. CAU 1642]MCK7595547.1 ferredoxin reductase [Lysobacter sp. CAU 1642]